MGVKYSRNIVYATISLVVSAALHLFGYYFLSTIPFRGLHGEVNTLEKEPITINMVKNNESLRQDVSYIFFEFPFEKTLSSTYIPLPTNTISKALNKSNHEFNTKVRAALLDMDRSTYWSMVTSQIAIREFEGKYRKINEENSKQLNELEQEVGDLSEKIKQLSLRGCSKIVNSSELEGTVK